MKIRCSTCSLAAGILAAMLCGAQIPPVVTNPPLKKDASELKDVLANPNNATLTAKVVGPTVQGSVSVEAVLIPSKIAKSVFGRAIAKNYATVEITISNRNPDAALIVHSIFLDYSSWLLSGSPLAFAANNLVPTYNLSGKSDGNGSRDQGGTSKQSLSEAPFACQSSGLQLNRSDRGAPVNSWQSSGCANQVSSVESRIARGQLLTAQNSTVRNIVIRSLQALGTTAAGFQFAFKEQGIIRGIAAYNGQFVPAANILWPDDTVAQMDRISDFGFRTNQVVGKQSSDITIAFFPVERFLTKGFKEQFLKSPAVFYAPLSILADDKLDKSSRSFFCRLVVLSRNLAASDAGRGNKLPFAPQDQPQAKSGTKDQPPGSKGKMKTGKLEAAACSNITTNELVDQVMNNVDSATLINLMDGLSLNQIHVVIGGSMTVDVDSVPATVGGLSFTDDATAAAFWTEAGKSHEGKLGGKFLSSGTVSVEEAAALGITIQTDLNSATDSTLPFTIKLSKPIDSGTHLHFLVTKKNKDEQTIVSGPFDYAVNYQNKPQFSIDFNKKDSSKEFWTQTGKDEPGTLTGKNLKDGLPSIAESSQLGITIVQGPQPTSDTSIPFMIKLSKSISGGVKFHFLVTTKDQQGKTIVSDAVEYTVPNYNGVDVEPPQPAKK